jgi:glucose dehydrogenase
MSSMSIRFPNCLIAYSLVAASFSYSPIHADPASRLSDGEWPVNGGNLTSARYSPLDQMDASKLSALQIVWRWSAQNFGEAPEFNDRVTPIMVDGVFTPPRNRGALSSPSMPRVARRS